MCGIVGIISLKEFSIKKDLLRCLKRLEYRGYDSVGYAVLNGKMEQAVGYIDSFIEKVRDSTTTLAISHSRWATHGGITEINAHPHTNSDKTIFTVHNGIIENYLELKKKLEEKGYKFITQTDSEIIPHYFEEQFKNGNDIHQAVKNFFKDIKGTYAILMFRKNENTLYALKNNSPLAFGFCKNKFILASDIYAFSDETNRAVFFDDYEYAIVKPDSYHFYNNIGEEISKEPITFEWTREEQTKEQYSHYMIKEIKEQPISSKRLIDSFSLIQKSTMEKFVDLLKKYKDVVFVACGTSYHAGLVGSILLNSLGFNTRAVIASEISSFITFGKDTLCIAISQSGETMDVVAELKKAKEAGSKILSIVNVPYSTIQRMSETSIELLAGQEVCVASTKTFTNQVIVLLEAARRLGYKIDLSIIPKRIQQTIALNEDKIKELAKELYKKNDVFVLGRGISYPMAREIALKLKEIPYMHAEGMMAGELKHGTIALIEEGTPVISLIPNNNLDMISSTKEVEARGARSIIISNTQGELMIPKCCDAEFAIYAGIIGHLLAYHIGLLRGVSIDKPRNLAKCVSVK